MTTDPIRIRITPREPKPTKDRSPRDAFWAAIREPNESEQSIAAAEAKLCRRLGLELRDVLVRNLAEPLRTYDSEFLRELEHLTFRFDRPRPDRDWYGFQSGDALLRILEQRQQMLRESPAFRHAQERLAATGAVTFAVRLGGYSSLNLEIVPGSINNSRLCSRTTSTASASF